MIRFTITKGIKEILEENDRLGFDSIREAAAAILTHEDYASRWDFSYTNPIDFATLDTWKNNTLINQ